MITEALIRMFTGLVNFVIGLLPNSGPPSWLTGASGTLSTVWGYGSGLGAWIPWPIAGTVVSAVLLCVGLGLAIKLARIVASFFTVGGGSAG